MEFSGKHIPKTQHYKLNIKKSTDETGRIDKKMWKI